MKRVDGLPIFEERVSRIPVFGDGGERVCIFSRHDEFYWYLLGAPL